MSLSSEGGSLPMAESPGTLHSPPHHQEIVQVPRRFLSGLNFSSLPNAS